MSWGGYGGGKGGGGKGGPQGKGHGAEGRSDFGGYGGDAAALFNKQTATGINFEEAHKMPVEVSPVDPNTPPMDDWTSNGVLAHEILANIQRCNYKRPTPVQKHGIPIIAAGKDLVASAQTGSGKTAVFLLPSINTLLRENFTASWGDNTSYVGVLCLAPSRELASQIFEESQKFCYNTAIRPAVVYGGADFRPQISALAQGVELLVATPGRLIDHYEKGRINLKYLKVFIMDEADRMLDMGFEPQIRQIATKCGMPRKRQTLMFSATFPSIVQRLTQDFVGEDYTFMTIGRVGSTHSYIKQSLMWVEDADKRLVLLGILMAQPGMTLVFLNTKQETTHVCRFLREQGFQADSIHGDRTQAEREYALQRFKDRDTMVLCATDVAARGLDIQGVELVVQYDMPTDVDDYIHRVGRTGRAGNQGLAVGFVNGRNRALAPDLCARIMEANQPVPAWLMGMAHSLGGPTQMETTQFGGQDIRLSGKKAHVKGEAVHKDFSANAYGDVDVGGRAGEQQAAAAPPPQEQYHPQNQGWSQAHGGGRGGGRGNYHSGGGGGGGGYGRGYGGGGNNGGGGY